jgi:hypothetical protein
MYCTLEAESYLKPSRRDKRDNSAYHQTGEGLAKVDPLLHVRLSVCNIIQKREEQRNSQECVNRYRVLLGNIITFAWK